jgi:glucosylceramidase
MKSITWFVVVLVLFSCRPQADVEWISSAMGGEMFASRFISLKKLDADNPPLEGILPGQRQQVIDGFGFCFNELGFEALNALTPAEQEKILSGFFEPGSGFNLNICRMPIGANDYALDWYSLNEAPGDFALEKFSIERDRSTLIPYIKRALQYNPDLKIWGSPWCPPSWMKANGHYACRPDAVNDLSESGAGMEGATQFIMEPKYLGAYALYFRKYLDAYQAEGIPVYAVHVQNEPNSCQNFPSCIWTAGDIAEFIGNYLGPVLREHYPQVQIWYGTIERPSIEKIDTVLKHPAASAFVKGLGFQWAGKNAIVKAYPKYPDMPLMQTESECGDGSNDWAASEHTWSLICHYLNHGARAYMYWNPILDESGKSQWGWKQNSLISVDTQRGEARYNPEYYLFKHLTSRIVPGAIKVQVSGDQETLAFQNPGGEVVILAANTSGMEKKMVISISGRVLDVTLTPKSYHTFVVPASKG